MINLTTIFLLVVVLIILFSRTEGFQEIFALAGYKKPVSTVIINENKFDMTGYSEVDSNITNEMMNEFVLATNKAVEKATGLCTYIIETNSVKTYSKDDKKIYLCKFTLTTTKGFVFGFSVHSVIKDGKVVSLETQPMKEQTENVLQSFDPSKVEENFKPIKEFNVPTDTRFKDFKLNYENL